MMSLFSPFDLYSFESSLLMMLAVLSLWGNSHFYVSSFTATLSSVSNIMFKFFYSLKEKMFTKNLSVFFFCVFNIIFLLNFTSVWSFNFAYTSQVGVVMYISLFMWASLVLFQSAKNLKYLLSHCIPEGTPIYLTWFLFLIEAISNLIRPITLTVRLVANILAGHLLMILLSKLVFLFYPCLFLYAVLNLVELFVSLIQGYIFCTMVVLYFSELE